MKIASTFGKFIVIIFLLISFVSCVSKKEIIYLQDIDTNLKERQLTSFETEIVFDDLLRIIVTSENMESVLAYNRIVGTTGISTDLQVNGQSRLQSYLVDSKGYINFPVLGEIKVAGLTRSGLKNFLEKELKRYVKDVVVDVRILNIKFTVLGEVNKPGTYSTTDNRITLFQALGLAGDLNIYGKRDNIIILRDLNGIQSSTRVDITNTNFINSNFYYLKQNDTIIVEPNKAQVQAAGFNRNISIYVSIASLILSTVVVLSNLNR